MKNILVVTTTLEMGGISSYTINLVNELAKDYEVTVANINDELNLLNELDSNVNVKKYRSPSNKNTLIQMAKHGWLNHALKIKLRNNKEISPITSLQRLAYARAEITDFSYFKNKEFDIVISTSELYCNDIVAMKIEAKTRVAWIHPDYRALKADVEFDKKTLDIFDWIAVVSEKNKINLISLIPEYKNKTIYIPNLLNADDIRKKAEQRPLEYEGASGEKIIVTVCRLDNSSKRLDRIVRIARALKEQNENFVWYIVGDGKDKKNVEDEIKNNMLEQELIMLGGKVNPYPYVKYADLFVLTSQYEGRPISVDEALILNCPVIVSAYSAAGEQIKSEYGTIIENNDDSFVDQFLKSLDWAELKEKKKYLETHDVLEGTKQKFRENINIILKPRT